MGLADLRQESAGALKGFVKTGGILATFQRVLAGARFAGVGFRTGRVAPGLPAFDFRGLFGARFMRPSRQFDLFLLLVLKKTKYCDAPFLKGLAPNRRAFG